MKQVPKTKEDTMKKQLGEALSAHLAAAGFEQASLTARLVVEQMTPIIEAAVMAGCNAFLAERLSPLVEATRANASGHGNGRVRSLDELKVLPADALVTPHEASLITGLTIETMKSKRRFNSFPESVQTGHRTIKWRMGDLRKFIKESRA